jgi:voltage-gated potassium channel
LTGFNSPLKRQDFRQAMRDRSRVGLFIARRLRQLSFYASKGGILVFGLTTTFLKQFGIGLWLTFPLLLSLAAAITLLGQTVGRKEGWSRFDSFYWSFITATTVGYGDIRPSQNRSRILAILIAFLGLVLTGIVIAVAVRAGSLALGTPGS